MTMELSSQVTWLHKINPSFKFVIIVILFLGLLFIHDINVMVNLMFGTLILYVCFTGHPWKRLLLIAIPFLLIFITSSTSMIFFGKGDVTWFKWGFIHITEESFFRGVHLGVRGIEFALLGVTFALTTRPVYLFYSFMQQLKLKPKYAYSFMAAIRLLPIMIEELQTLRYALKIRGVKHHKGLRGLYERLKFFSIPLLAQSIRRAHRIAVAMEAKRFSQTSKRTYYYQLGFSRYDFLFVVFFLLIITISYVAMIYFPYVDIHDVRYEG
ncbi:energy-coupling factor transporter transmembrane component T family protein [Aquibacillus kalidii]|uniref:energy-coupling factor transporter transmembrane component T family protein n=1 Tax=Aquibacillus kalidii TaxID=2762597 RepID=UPI0016478752|nr:energy-coupling factor transporter transmembrane component T [Aquibacillus kalidii]